MIIFKKLFLFFLLFSLFLSSSSAYNLSDVEKNNWDRIVNILENKISIKGESYRQVYIKLLNKLKINKNEKIVALIDYVITSLDNEDISYLFEDKNTNIPWCKSTIIKIDSKFYNLPNLTQWQTYNIHYDSYILNGIAEYYNNYKCENSEIKLIESKMLVKTQCNSWYQSSWNSCVVDNLNIKDCSYTTRHLWDHTYPISTFKNWEIINSISNYVLIQNWKQYFNQRFSCDNWVINTIGTENIDRTECNTWYKELSNLCVSNTGILSITWWYDKTYWNLKNSDLVILWYFKIDPYNTYNSVWDFRLKLKFTYGTDWYPKIRFSDIYLIDQNNNIINRDYNFASIWSDTQYFDNVKKWMWYFVYWKVETMSEWNESVSVKIDSVEWYEFSSDWIWKIDLWK